MKHPRCHEVKNSKLTPQNVATIRLLLAYNLATQAQLSETYQVSIATISRVKTNRTWKLQCLPTPQLSALTAHLESGRTSVLKLLEQDSNKRALGLRT